MCPYIETFKLVRGEIIMPQQIITLSQLESQNIDQIVDKFIISHGKGDELPDFDHTSFRMLINELAKQFSNSNTKSWRNATNPSKAATQLANVLIALTVIAQLTNRQNELRDELFKEALNEITLLMNFMVRNLDQTHPKASVIEEEYEPQRADHDDHWHLFQFFASPHTDKRIKDLLENSSKENQLILSTTLPLAITRKHLKTITFSEQLAILEKALDQHQTNNNSKEKNLKLIYLISRLNNQNSDNIEQLVKLLEKYPQICNDYANQRAKGSLLSENLLDELLISDLAKRSPLLIGSSPKIDSYAIEMCAESSDSEKIKLMLEKITSEQGKKKIFDLLFSYSYTRSYPSFPELMLSMPFNNNEAKDILKQHGTADSLIKRIKEEGTHLIPLIYGKENSEYSIAAAIKSIAPLSSIVDDNSIVILEPFTNGKPYNEAFADIINVFSYIKSNRNYDDSTVRILKQKNGRLTQAIFGLPGDCEEKDRKSLITEITKIEINFFIAIENNIYFDIKNNQFIQRDGADFNAHELIIDKTLFNKIFSGEGSAAKNARLGLISIAPDIEKFIDEEAQTTDLHAHMIDNVTLVRNQELKNAETCILVFKEASQAPNNHMETSKSENKLSSFPLLPLANIASKTLTPGLHYQESIDQIYYSMFEGKKPSSTGSVTASSASFFNEPGNSASNSHNTGEESLQTKIPS